MRAAVTTDIGGIADLIRRAEAAAEAEDWNLAIMTLREASYDCLLLSRVLTHTEPPSHMVDLRDPDSSEFWHWH